jgi:hypothetical protein
MTYGCRIGQVGRVVRAVFCYSIPEASALPLESSRAFPNDGVNTGMPQKKLQQNPTRPLLLEKPCLLKFQLCLARMLSRQQLIHPTAEVAEHIGYDFPERFGDAEQAPERERLCCD